VPISTNLGTKLACGMGIQLCSNNGAVPNMGNNTENFDKSSKIFSCTTGRNARGKEIQVCSNEFPWVM